MSGSCVHTWQLGHTHTYTHALATVAAHLGYSRIAVVQAVKRWVQVCANVVVPQRHSDVEHAKDRNLVPEMAAQHSPKQQFSARQCFN